MATRPKPPISLWIASERKRHGWKAEELSRRLVEAGYAAEVSTVRVWEAGRRPQAETIDALERLFGSTAPSEDVNSADLASAIRELTEMVALQTQVLRAILGTPANLTGGLADRLTKLDAIARAAEASEQAPDLDPVTADV